MFSHHHGTLNLRVFVIVEDGRTIGTYNIEVDKAIEQRYLYNIIDIFGMVHTFHTLPNIPKYMETKIPLGSLVRYLLPAIVAVAGVVGVLVATAGPGHRSEWEDLAGHLGARNGWYPMVY